MELQASGNALVPFTGYLHINNEGGLLKASGDMIFKICTPDEANARVVVQKAPSEKQLAELRMKQGKWLLSGVVDQSKPFVWTAKLKIGLPPVVVRNKDGDETMVEDPHVLGYMHVSMRPAAGPNGAVNGVVGQARIELVGNELVQMVTIKAENRPDAKYGLGLQVWWRYFPFTEEFNTIVNEKRRKLETVVELN